MSEAPERIWTSYADDGSGLWYDIKPPEGRYIAGYRRADLHSLPDGLVKVSAAMLNALAKYADTERAHKEADEVLCRTLRTLGLSELVEAWERVPKWYG